MTDAPELWKMLAAMVAVLSLLVLTGGGRRW